MPSTSVPLTGETLDKAKRFQPRLKIPSGERGQLINVWVSAARCNGLLCFLFVYEWVISHITFKTVYHYTIRRLVRRYERWVRRIKRKWVRVLVRVATWAIIAFIAYLVYKYVAKWVLKIIVTYWLVVLIVVIILIIVMVIIYYYYRHDWDYEPVIVCIEGDTVVCVCYDAGHYEIGKLSPPSTPPGLEVVPGTHNFEPGDGTGNYTTNNLKELTRKQIDEWNKKLKDLPRKSGQPVLSLEGAFTDPCKACKNTWFTDK